MWQQISLGQVLDQANLLKAWDHVKRNRGGPGIDGLTISSFDRNLYKNLGRLKRDIYKHQYQPNPLKVVWIEKPNGGLRKLAIPTVCDRVIQTAVYLKLLPLLEQEFEDASYGYRPGRSVYHALAEIQLAYQQGYRWLLDADIEQYFDNIPHRPLLNLLAGSQIDKPLLRLIRQWLRVPLQDKSISYCHCLGVPQGSPISPLLSNLYLDKFDERFLSHDLKLIRYADDFVVLAKSEREARQAQQLTEESLKALSLSLNKRKTAIRSFEQGFEFLGAQIEGALIEVPPQNQANYKRIANQATESQSVLDMPIASSQQLSSDYQRRSLYLNRQGSVVHKQGLRLIVKHRGEVISSVPAPKIDLIFIFGNVHLTTPVTQFCLRERIPIAILSQTGYWIGEIASRTTSTIALQQAQFHANEKQQLRIAKQLINAKIQNSLVLLRRLNQRRQVYEVQEVIQSMKTQRDALPFSRSTDQLLGHEGMAARMYFAGARALMPTHWKFKKRPARPAPDPINALLSLGYSILYHNVQAILTGLGFQVMKGLMHRPSHGHAALASDLMEEFRPIIIDSIVWSLTLNNKISPAQFSFVDDRCELKPELRKLYIGLIERNLQRRYTHHTGKNISFRYAIELQARQLALVLKGKQDHYQAVKIR